MHAFRHSCVLALAACGDAGGDEADGGGTVATTLADESGGSEGGELPDVWTAIGEPGETIQAIARAPSGELVVAGTSLGDVWVAGFDATDGTRNWSVTVDHVGGSDIAVDVAVASDGSIVAVGTAWLGEDASAESCTDPEGGCPQFRGIWTGSFGPDGTTQWTDVYAADTQPDDEGTAVVVAESGERIVGGRLFPAGDLGGLVRAFDSAGNVVWEAVIPQYASVTDLALAEDGTIFAADGRQRRLHALAPDGTLLWTVDTSESYVEQIAVVDDGTLVGVDLQGGFHHFAADGTTLAVRPPPGSVFGAAIAGGADVSATVGSTVDQEMPSKRRVWVSGVTNSTALEAWTMIFPVGPVPQSSDANDLDEAFAALWVDGDLVVGGAVFVDDPSDHQPWLSRLTVP